MRFATRILALMALSTLMVGTASAAFSLEGKKLTAALAGGGYVILMRHASSPVASPTAAQAAPANVGHERQLDEPGRSSARAMGEALRRLHITIGKALSSTSFRALETAQLMELPDPHTYNDLADSGRSAESAGSLQAQVAVAPDPATNTVIITQAGNIMDAFPDDAKELADGEALIFHPDGHGKAAFVSRVKIDEWPKLAAP